MSDPLAGQREAGRCLVCDADVDPGEPGALVQRFAQEGLPTVHYCAEHAHRATTRPPRASRPKVVEEADPPEGQTVRVVDGELRLTPEQRKAFFAGRWPELVGTGKPPELTKLRYELSDRLALTVRVHRSRKGWRLEPTIHDDRDERYFLLASSTGLAVDERGRPLEAVPPEEDIGYTRNPKREAIVDASPAVRPDVQNVLDMRARLHDSEYDREQRAEREAERDLQRVQAEVRELAKRAVRMGVDPMVAMAPIAKAIERAQRELSEEAA